MSSPHGIPTQVQVGKVVGTHGHDGRLRVEPETDNPQRFSPGTVLTIRDVSYRVRRSVRGPGGRVLLVKLEGLDSREVAAELLHEPIMVNVADVPDLSEDAYYHYQLLDMRVFDTRGPELGVLTEVIETGSNDVYVVTGENSELMVPALANVIVEVDVEGGRMVVDLPEGIEPRPLRPPKRKHRSRVAKRRKRPHVGLRGELV